MKKILLLSLLLAGCSTTVPVVSKFPEAPPTLLEKCPELKLLSEKPNISEVSSTINTNYGYYGECKATVEGWIEWYQEQKRNSDSISK